MILLLACAQPQDTDSSRFAPEGVPVLVHDFTDRATTLSSGISTSEPCAVQVEGGADYAPCCPADWIFIGLSYDGVVCGKGE